MPSSVLHCREDCPPSWVSSPGLGGLSPGAQCPWSWGAGAGVSERQRVCPTLSSRGVTFSHSYGSAWLKGPHGSLAQGLGHHPFALSQGDKTFRSPKVALPPPATPWAGAVPSASSWSGRRLRSPSDHMRRSFCCFMAWRGCRAGALLGQGSGHPDLPWESSPCSLVPFLSPPASRLPLQWVPGPPSSSLSEARGLVLPQPVLGPSLAGPWDGCVRRPLPAGAEGAEGLPTVGSVWG